LKNLSVNISPASFLVKLNDVSLLVPSMVLSTIQVLVIMTVAPWLAPVLMADIQRSPA
jgi:hypothetical protein